MPVSPVIIIHLCINCATTSGLLHFSVTIPAAIIEFTRPNYTLDETIGLIFINITRRGYTNGASSVNCVLKSVTATASLDFFVPNAPDEVKFEKGVQHQGIIIPNYWCNHRPSFTCMEAGSAPSLKFNNNDNFYIILKAI